MICITTMTFPFGNCRKFRHHPQGVRNALVTGEEYLIFLEKSLKLAEYDKRVRTVAKKIIVYTKDEKIINEAKKLL